MTFYVLYLNAFCFTHIDVERCYTDNLTIYGARPIYYICYIVSTKQL